MYSTLVARGTSLVLLCITQALHHLGAPSMVLMALFCTTSSRVSFRWVGDSAVRMGAL